MVSQRGLIAQKLIKGLRTFKGRIMFDFEQLDLGRRRVEDLQETVASKEGMAKLHPARALYVYAQNQVAMRSEQITQLPALSHFAALVGKAEDEYLPSGSPMRPLTTSYFTCWALFDPPIGASRRTIGTYTLEVAGTLWLDPDLLRPVSVMRESQMGFCVLRSFAAKLHGPPPDAYRHRMPGQRPKPSPGRQRRAVARTGPPAAVGGKLTPCGADDPLSYPPAWFRWVACVLREDSLEDRPGQWRAGIRVPGEVRTGPELLERVHIPGVCPPTDRSGLYRRASGH